MLKKDPLPQPLPAIIHLDEVPPKPSSLVEALRFAATLTQPSTEDIKYREVALGAQTKKHTLILDIDSTLVFTKLSVLSPGKSTSMEVLIRPYTKELLETMSHLYEIVLFTAGTELYAEKIKRCLDPSGSLISRAFGSESCILTKEGFYVKDLRIFVDRSLKNLIIVDDKVTSFAFQPMNGIPVVAFKGEEDDDELKFLIEYLAHLYKYDDVRCGNKENIYEDLADMQRVLYSRIHHLLY
eukprot:TRINITY_DN340_c4_g1_i2.p1 TRINITY_DN340_c4_g1~~TRINITY_DN340_c4_g1_i2.p1  ORF type:complete len:240 (-),score=20.44 TRINITY_DN340_c4_g1_i2:257-976(-)